MIIRQIKIGSFAVFCYIVGCGKTGLAAVIDPGGGPTPSSTLGRERRTNIIAREYRSCREDDTARLPGTTRDA